MVILNVIFFLIVGFLGYLIGRWGDNYLNFWLKDPHWLPDHWIYGLILMLAGLFLFKDGLSLWIFSLGLGLLTSDLKDFLKLKFFGSDNKDRKTKKFWHID